MNSMKRKQISIGWVSPNYPPKKYIDQYILTFSNYIQKRNRVEESHLCCISLIFINPSLFWKQFSPHNILRVNFY